MEGRKTRGSWADEVGGREVGTQRGQGLERLGGQPEPYLGHKEHHQGDIGGENYGEEKMIFLKNL